MNWKNRLKGEKKMEKTTQELSKRREDLWVLTGQKQFTKAFIEAELIQYNQEILNINNELGKRSQAAVQKPTEAPEPLKVVTPDEILPSEIPAPKLETPDELANV